MRWNYDARNLFHDFETKWTIRLGCVLHNYFRITCLSTEWQDTLLWGVSVLPYCVLASWIRDGNFPQHFTVVRGFVLLRRSSQPTKLRATYQGMFFFSKILFRIHFYILWVLCAELHRWRAMWKRKYINLTIWTWKRSSTVSKDTQRVMSAAFAYGSTCGWCHPMNEYARQTNTISTHLACKRQSRHRQSTSLSQCRLRKVQTTRDIAHYITQVNRSTYDSQSASQPVHVWQCVGKKCRISNFHKTSWHKQNFAFCASKPNEPKWHNLFFESDSTHDFF